MLSEERLAWLRFANAELSPRAGHALLDRYGTPEAVFETSPEELQAVPGVSAEQVARLLDPARVPSSQQLETLARLHVRLVTRDDADFPEGLRDIPDSPVCLFVRGHLDERDRFAIAIVGTRHPTPYGREIASTLSRDLVELGFTVVSGGATGIDAAAHWGAVKAGGRTIAVLGCGCDIPYPALNQALFRQIVEQEAGAIISEYPLGATPEAWRFPVRNRLISGLAMGVVVVEAGLQSGALITASTAADQGREVMAVPGNIDRPTSAGANALIRDGAGLVTCAQDIVAQLGVIVQPRPQEDRQVEQLHSLSDEQRRVLAKLSLTPMHVDDLCSELGMSTAEMLAVLTILEIRGLVHRQPGATYIRAL